VASWSIPEFFVAPFLAVLGLLIGSFLNVVIARVPEGLSVVSPPSRCPKCGHSIAWYENVPVLSWLFLRGRCAGCKAPISARYVLVELLTGTLFVACYVRFGVDWSLALGLLMLCFAIPLTFTDAEHWILPDQLTLPGIALGVLMRIPLGTDAVIAGIIGAVGGFVLVRAIEWFGWLAFRKEAMGGGDKFLMALLGAFLGWRPILGIMLLSTLQGAVWGISMLLMYGRARPDFGATTSPSAETTAASETEGPDTLKFSPAMLARKMTLSRRLLLIPYTLFLQDIPDPPVATEGSEDEPEWVPEKGSMPFGPWLCLAAVEIMLLGPTMLGLTEGTMLGLFCQTMLGETR
jgi:leader peptidase (prepilin peptidase) / N-methyltransferase